MEEEILKTIRYFDFFNYCSSFNKIYQFLSFKTTKKQLKEKLLILERQKKIKKFFSKEKSQFLYTLGEYYRKFKIQNSKFKVNLKFKAGERFKESRKKLKNWRFRLYVKLLSFFPQVKLVGLSGSIAMMNAGKDDDIDLFIITAKNRLFTGRFIAVILAEMMGIRRKRDLKIDNKQRITGHHIFDSTSSLIKVRGSPKSLTEKHAPSFLLINSSYKNKVCLNLFFDENNLIIPKFKQTLFVGHEVLQMRPLINKDSVYERFLAANDWVFKLFPNILSTLKLKIKTSKLNLSNSKSGKDLKLGLKNFSDWLENQLKKIQLKLINRHKTIEIITNSQLWFHPEDFERKVKHL